MADFEVPGFEILRRLGEGGMGQVVQARRLEDGLEVAIKVAHVDGPDQDQGRLKAEAEILRRVRSPFVPRFLGLVRSSQGPALVMEFLRGRALDEVLQGVRGSNERWQVLRKVLPGVIEGLRAIHRCGAVHRDLKPENILVLDETGEGALIDLGLAKSDFLPPLTKTGFVMGTIAYMAPEQLAGSKSYTPATDVYQLAMVILRVLEDYRPKGMQEEIDEGMQRCNRAPDLSGYPLEPAARAWVESVLAPAEGDRGEPGERLVALAGVLLGTTNPRAKSTQEPEAHATIEPTAVAAATISSTDPATPPPAELAPAADAPHRTTPRTPWFVGITCAAGFALASMGGGPPAPQPRTTTTTTIESDALTWRFDIADGSASLVLHDPELQVSLVETRLQSHTGGERVFQGSGARVSIDELPGLTGAVRLLTAGRRFETRISWREPLRGVVEGWTKEWIRTDPGAWTKIALQDTSDPDQPWLGTGALGHPSRQRLWRDRGFVRSSIAALLEETPASLFEALAEMAALELGRKGHSSPAWGLALGVLEPRLRLGFSPSSSPGPAEATHTFIRHVGFNFSPDRRGLLALRGREGRDHVRPFEGGVEVRLPEASVETIQGTQVEVGILQKDGDPSRFLLAQLGDGTAFRLPTTKVRSWVFGSLRSSKAASISGKRPEIRFSLGSYLKEKPPSLPLDFVATQMRVSEKEG